MADEKEKKDNGPKLGWGLAEKARQLLKGNRDAQEDRLRQIMQDGETPSQTVPAVDDGEHGIDKRDSVHK